MTAREMTPEVREAREALHWAIANEAVFQGFMATGVQKAIDALRSAILATECNSERDSMCAFIRDRAAQYPPDSYMVSFLGDLRAWIAGGDHVESAKCGDLDDLMNNRPAVGELVTVGLDSRPAVIASKAMFRVDFEDGSNATVWVDDIDRDPSATNRKPTP